MEDGPSKETAEPLVRSLRSTVGRESTTFGFSILATVTFGMLTSTHGPPSTLRVFGYAVGAVMSFTILEGLLSHGFRLPMPQHATQTLTLGTSLNVVSVVGALALAWAFAEATSGLLAWAGAPLVAGTAYLLLESLEEAAAERVLVASGDGDAEATTNQDS
ncbi:hypothetical protein [Nocardioides sp. SYSU DS0651]|uniref:hypothetical protein n=1 Tax=Nocardioides sp. SYSU DS0651 TaxID=3415955 RepID=UPI003F4BBA4C